MEREFNVSLIVPEGATLAMVTSYIEEAIGAWRGSLNPEDPMFYLDGELVKVTHVPKRKSK